MGARLFARVVGVVLAGAIVASCTSLQQAALDGAADGQRDGSAVDTNVADVGLDVTDASTDVPCIHDAPAIPHDGGHCGSFTGASCDPFANTGCPTGERCAIIRWASGAQVACLPPGSAHEGDHCSTSADCDAGLHCLLSGPAPAVCVHACCAAYGDGDAYCNDVAPGRIGSRCTVQTGSGIVRACTVPGDCDYLVPSSCPPSTECAPITPYGQPQCVTPGHTAPDAACMYSSECTAGYTCLTPAAGGPGRCTAVCNPQNPCSYDPTTCVCSQFNDRPVDFGSCI